ncbi:MAG: oligosaccharide flippase family protein [Acidobacteria bacterium]|nr:oligosaccharide flippase family protein [Acidobacteriota bacterium]
MLASRVLSILVVPIYARYLSTAEFGVLELLDLTLYFFTALCALQLSNAVVYCVGDRPPESHNRIYSTVLIAGLSFGMGVFLMGSLSSPVLSRLVFNSTAYTAALIWYFAAFALNPVIEVGMIILRLKDRIGVMNTVAIARSVLQAVLSIIFLSAFRLGYMSFAWSSLAVSVLFGLGVLAVAYSQMPIVLDRAIMKTVVKYAAPLGLGSFAMLIVHYGDRFFLQRYASLSDVGIYALANKIGMLVYFFQGPFSAYWAVERFRVMNDPAGAAHYVRIFTYLTLAQGAALLALAVAARPVVALFLPPAYADVATYVPWIALAFVLRSLGEHLRGVLLVRARTTYDTAICVAGSVLCLLLYLGLIPSFHVAGATAATVIAFAALVVISFVAAQRAHHFDYEYGRLARIAVAVCVPVCALFAVLPVPLWLQTLLGLACLLFYAVILRFSGFFQPDELDALRRNLSKAKSLISA